MKLPPDLESSILAGKGQRTPPTVNGKPVDCGSEGSQPTGAQAHRKRKTELVAFACRRLPTASAYDNPFWVEWDIPIELEAMGNTRTDRRGASGKLAMQKWAFIKALARDWLIWGPLGSYCRQHGKLAITFTRLGGRRMDRSNLPRTFKHIEDALALIMGCDDGWPTWHADWQQQTDSACGLRVRVEKE